MTFASLFSGIGGADIAGIAAGFEHKFWCEIDPFCRKVLSYWFKNSEGYGDIKETDFRKWRGQINVLHGSTPCQSVSIAGKRRGDSDDRWLWRQMLRAIREIRPTWVTFENVANIKNVVSSNEKPVMENGESYVLQEGLLYGIIEDLESEGYEVQSYLIPACAVGAPHERKRIWIVARRTEDDDNGQQAIADSDSSGFQTEGTEQQTAGIAGSSIQRTSSESGIERCGSRIRNWEERPIYTEFEWDMAKGEPEWDEWFCRTCKDGEDECSSNANGKFMEGWNDNREDERSVKEKSIELSGLPGNWEMFPTQSPVCGRDDGISFGLDPKAFPRWRRESIKALGNALVPQVIYEIYKSINQIEYGKEK